MRDPLSEFRWRLVVRFMGIALRRWQLDSCSNEGGGEEAWRDAADRLERAAVVELEKTEIPD